MNDKNITTSSAARVFCFTLDFFFCGLYWRLGDISATWLSPSQFKLSLLCPHGVPPPPPTLSQEEAAGRGALLTDICHGARLKQVAVVKDRSAPLLHSKSPERPSEHPYVRLYQYLHHQQGAPSEEQHQAAPQNGSSGRSPSTRAAAPRPPSHRHDDPESPSPQMTSPTETGPPQRPSPSPSMKHSSSAPPPPHLCRRGNAPLPPYSKEKPLPLTPPLPSKPPPSPSNSRRPPTSGGNPPSSSSLAPPPPLYRQSGGEAAPELPQRHNALSDQRAAPSTGGHTPTRGPAPPLPPASPTPSPFSETPGRGAAPPVPVQPSLLRPGGREAPPPPPYKPHGSPSLSSDPPARGRPPPPPTGTPAAPPPPPPSLHNGHSPSSFSAPRSFVDDFESRYSFHRLDDFPPPEEQRHLLKVYPSQASRVMRGAPPLPPVGR
ncbi:WAS/WASL-interacting protein family member 2-like isoform X1 [Pseudoliparis swirei]|uniref:WAS/WASL-interacting protein family member 2-like isoform X1 n=1 Tax=Pseudoliparis swirei TaxID=2059687 RepID=UPI0024BE12C6|nr:WAS/WASL-interacting protein family member 2-like isoform X1 [Pseudoliparis swirei]